MTFSDAGAGVAAEAAEAAEAADCEEANEADVGGIDNTARSSGCKNTGNGQESR